MARSTSHITKLIKVELDEQALDSNSELNQLFK